jgi:glycosyltransferase involved in cell wall biosynthesis
MRLLFVTPYYKPAYVYGGPVRSIPALCESLAAMGANVTVHTTDANGRGSLSAAASGQKHLNGVEVRYFRRRGTRTYYYSSDLARACLRDARHFDLIYVFSNWCYPLLPACRAARSASVPCVVSPRTSFMSEAWKRKRLKKLIYHLLVERASINSAAALHYTSTFELEQSRWLRLKPRAFVIPNPVDRTEFQRKQARGGFRRKHGIPDDLPVILCLGRLEHRKGLDLTLTGFAGMPSGGARLVIAGPDEDGQLARLRLLAQNLGIEGRVVFTGMLDSAQRIQAFADADIFLLTSRSENFGVAVVEAMAAGLPVIVSNLVGIAPEISRFGAGITVALDPRAISTALTTLASSPCMRHALGIRGVQLAGTLFDPRAVAQKMMERFHSIIAACPRPAGRSRARLPKGVTAACSSKEPAGCAS